MPSDISCIIADICGNDFFKNDVVAPFDLKWLDSATSFVAAMQKKSSNSYAVIGASSAVWRYDYMSQPMQALFDSHGERVRRHFNENGVRTTSGVSELLGIEIADAIGHVNINSKAQIFDAYFSWVRQCFSESASSASLPVWSPLPTAPPPPGTGRRGSR